MDTDAFKLILFREQYPKEYWALYALWLDWWRVEELLMIITEDRALEEYNDIIANTWNTEYHVCYRDCKSVPETLILLWNRGAV